MLAQCENDSDGKCADKGQRDPGRHCENGWRWPFSAYSSRICDQSKSFEPLPCHRLLQAPHCKVLDVNDGHQSCDFLIVLMEGIEGHCQKTFGLLALAPMEAKTPLIKPITPINHSATPRKQKAQGLRSRQRRFRHTSTLMSTYQLHWTILKMQASLSGLTHLCYGKDIFSNKTHCRVWAGWKAEW